MCVCLCLSLNICQHTLYSTRDLTASVLAHALFIIPHVQCNIIKNTHTWVAALICARNASLCPVWRSWTYSKACSLAAYPRLVAPDWPTMAERAASSSGSSREAAGVRARLKNSHFIVKRLSLCRQARRLMLFCACDDTLMANYNECTGLWPDFPRHLDSWQCAQNKATEPHVYCAYLIAFLLCCSQNMGWWPCAEATPADKAEY